MEDPFETLRRHMRQAAGHSRSMGPGTGPAEWRPQVDVYETDEAIVVVLELAGVNPEHIEIQVEGRRLYVKGARVPTPRNRTRRIHHLEIPHGHFHVAVDLPAAVDSSGADAVTHNGLLEVVLPLPRPFHPSVESGLETPMGEMQ